MTHRKKYTVKDLRTKYIRFINKSIEQLQNALVWLQLRYKKVRIERKLRGALYEGQVIVSY